MHTLSQPAIFFDMDGVLIDSEPVWLESIEQVFATLGIVLDDAMKTHTAGMGNVESVEWLLSLYPGVQADVLEICQQIDRTVLRRIECGIESIPGADGLLRDLVRRGVPMALVSTSGVELMAAVVRANQWDGCFRLVLSSEEIGPGKPDPAVYRAAVQRLQADPVRSLAIEDTINGARSAHGAGLRVIGLPMNAEVAAGMQPFVWQIAGDYAAVRKWVESVFPA